MIILHSHTSSLRWVEVCARQRRSPRPSALLTEGSLSVQRGERTRAADSRTAASAELSDPLDDHNTLFFSTLCVQALWTISLCDVGVQSHPSLSLSFVAADRE